MGCNHHTVRRYVELRRAGTPPDAPARRAKLIDAFMPKIEELVEASGGRIGADHVHKRLHALGFDGSERTTRRAGAAAKDSYQAGHRRVHRPWVSETGLWMQWDWGEGPRLGERRVTLWCAWLAWSRFRVVIPVLDKTIPTVAARLDATFRAVGGVPTYCLTDNEKTVTTTHIASLAVRNPDIVAIGRHYGTTIRTCLPADPASKGGAENTVKTARSPRAKPPATSSWPKSTPVRIEKPAGPPSKCWVRNASGCIQSPRRPTPPRSAPPAASTTATPPSASTRSATPSRTSTPDGKCSCAGTVTISW